MDSYTRGVEDCKKGVECRSGQGELYEQGYAEQAQKMPKPERKTINTTARMVRGRT